MIPIKDKLLEITHKLQKILRIQDWDIQIIVTNQYHLSYLMNCDHLDTAAICERTLKRKEAIIYINEDHSRINDEWYECIVHELYHIVTGDVIDIAESLTDNDFIKDQITQLKEQLVVNLQKTFTSLYPFSSLDIDLGDSNE